MEIKQYIEKMRPYRDVIVFMVTLMVANYFWKYTVIGDEDGVSNTVTWFGLDITVPFEVVSKHIAACVYWLVGLVRDTVVMRGDHVVGFENGHGSSIVWGCSGLKQMFIWMWLILTVKGGWKQKLWFIPLGWVVCHCFNILRIAIITLFLEFHPEWFSILHDYIFKYMFYGIMFLMWVWFVEKIRGRLVAE